MNNATRENSFHAISQTHNDKGKFLSSPKGNEELLGPNEIKEILHQLDQVKFSPRAAAVKAVMKYSREKNEVLREDKE